jgi:hypothetical protein
MVERGHTKVEQDIDERFSLPARRFPSVKFGKSSVVCVELPEGLSFRLPIDV